MQNQINFEGYFKREDIQALLDLDITQICVTGTVELDQGEASTTTVEAKGFGGTSITAASKTGCPRPCP